MSGPSAFIAGQNHGFQGDPICRGAGRNTHRVADGAPAELQNDVIAEMMQKLVHLTGMDTA